MTPPAPAAPRSSGRPNARSAPAAAPARQRTESIDVLRGIVLVLLLLDHTREFIHSQALLQDPTNLATTTPGLFLTRWITHFAAPAFVLLAGVSAALQLQQGQTKRQLSRFLATRGLWLIVLEVTVIRFGAFFNLDYSLGTPLQLIWVLGVSMIVLAALVHLPTVDVAVGAVVVIALHNVFDRLPVHPWGGPGTKLPTLGALVGTVLHVPGFLPGNLFVLYPLIPWVAVMAAGYALGTLWSRDREVRRRWLLRIGGACVALFVVLRAANIYGDPLKWAAQDRGPMFTAFSFVNTMKYPPSLLFLAMTLGPTLLLLAWIEARDRAPRTGARAIPARMLATLGAVPLFCYVLQWYVPHLLSWAAHLAAGRSTAHITLGPAAPPAMLRDAGFELPIVYLAWAVSLVLIYPACAWFAGVKSRRPYGWLRYM